MALKEAEPEAFRKLAPPPSLGRTAQSQRGREAERQRQEKTGRHRQRQRQTEAEKDIGSQKQRRKESVEFDDDFKVRIGNMNCIFSFSRRDIHIEKGMFLSRTV